MFGERIGPVSLLQGFCMTSYICSFFGSVRRNLDLCAVVVFVGLLLWFLVEFAIADYRAFGWAAAPVVFRFGGQPICLPPRVPTRFVTWGRSSGGCGHRHPSYDDALACEDRRDDREVYRVSDSGYGEESVSRAVERADGTIGWEPGLHQVVTGRALRY